ncbi:hypothetical protein [Pseudoflavonifractor sp. An184]|jgi:uncharacterized lipoprotein NlpE involved in copper resistance|uniref:hypothetical protein n=1 Tax=Pseudoflavonifractor sp. An184 TaxID=1965576 RepID=UPI0011218E61|nr:hypothetical protein [Pseudoflavonifractor sp. An184]
MKLVNKGKEGIILLCLLFPLSGCLNQGSSAGAESTAQDPVMNTIVERAFPFEENVTDVTLFFKEQEDIFDSDDPKESLVLDKTDAASISRTKDLVDIGGANKVRSMAVHCTWMSPARTLYIGLYNKVTDHYFIAMFDGGAVSGLLDLTELPEGQYGVVMYSSDNENVTAVMNYQFY